MGTNQNDESLTCPACGHPVEKRHKFCHNCGYPLAQGPVERYICNRCGHLSYIDLMSDDPAEKEKVKRCAACEYGAVFVKGKKAIGPR